jgi:hypothetical protein
MVRKKLPRELLRDYFAAAFKNALKRVLDVMRIQGWYFPSHFEMGVQILSDAPLVTMVKVRMDDVTRIARVRLARLRADLVATADDVAAAWLAKHATSRAVPPRMRCAAT